MNAILDFLSHYSATYALYLQSPIIYQTLFLYCVFMAAVIYFMAKKNDFRYFLPILFGAITASSCVYTYTFWSLW